MSAVYRRKPSKGSAIAQCAARALAMALFACGGGDPTEAPEPEHERQPEYEEPAFGGWPNPLERMPRGPEHTADVCARDGDDPVRDVFCAEEAPDLSSLADLQRALGLDSSVIGGVTGLSVTAHSTGLGIRSVSTINPRVIALRLEYDVYELAAISFNRGEQFAEIVVRDRYDKQLRFYVVAFRQPCNDAEEGCKPHDLLTPAIEENWTEVTLYDERDVTNTVMDCAPCHQPQGPETVKLLRMQEFDPPWTHWLFTGHEGGRALIEDYTAAKGDEPLAGMTAEQIRGAHPGNLSMLAKYGGSFMQPNVFDSRAIEQEVKTSAAERGGQQPIDNTIAGESPTWRAAYERAMRGEAIPVPYHDVKVTDAEKFAAMSEVYRAYQAGEIAPEELPDIRDVFPDDEKRLAAMGVMTEPGLDGRGVLLQACSQCHNERLDQNLSRARFRADLEGMDRAAKDRAIERLQLPSNDPLAMPPLFLKRLSEKARRRAIEALRE